MFLLNTVAPDQATGKVAEIYSAIPKEIGVPLPLQLFSASPDQLALRFEMIKYYMSHANLSFPLLAAIRYVAAHKSGHTACVDFNGVMLLKIGMTPEQVTKVLEDPKDSPLEEGEIAMLSLVVSALNDPASITAADIDAVRSHGFTDADIMDAMSQAANMVGGALLYKAFVRK